MIPNHMKRSLLFPCLLVAMCGRSQSIRILFDASQAEMAGNADWVVDADVFNIGVNSAHLMVTGAGNEADPQRYPTPAQSSISASTAQTYWKGALSYWAIDLVRQGYQVESLPYNGLITYGVTTNAQDLMNYKVFVVCEPNIRFSSSERTALISFVQNGGGLFMIADHTVSDRNNDGWDSPAIWNDLMTNNTIATNPFGFSIDLANFSTITSNVWTNAASSTILTGSQGVVTQMEFNNGTTATTNTAANPNVKGLIWKTGTAQNNSNVMSLSSQYGTGRVFFVGDSSPIDDGTGAPGNTLFVGWPNFSHKPLFLNASLWLAKLQ